MKAVKLKILKNIFAKLPTLGFTETGATKILMKKIVSLV